MVKTQVVTTYEVFIIYTLTWLKNELDISQMTLIFVSPIFFSIKNPYTCMLICFWSLVNGQFKRPPPTTASISGTFPTGNVTLPPKLKAEFRCPMECPVCQTLNNTLTKPCLAVDEFGDIRSDFEKTLTLKQRALYKELSDLNCEYCSSTTTYIRVCLQRVNYDGCK